MQLRRPFHFWMQLRNADLINESRHPRQLHRPIKKTLHQSFFICRPGQVEPLLQIPGPGIGSRVRTKPNRPPGKKQGQGPQKGPGRDKGTAPGRNDPTKPQYPAKKKERTPGTGTPARKKDRSPGSEPGPTNQASEPRITRRTEPRTPKKGQKRTKNGPGRKNNTLESHAKQGKAKF